MKKLLSIPLIVVGVLGLLWWQLAPTPSEPEQSPTYVGSDGSVSSEDSVPTSSPAETAGAVPRTEIVAENLTIPWEVLFLPDGELLVTERPGRVLLLKAGVELTVEGTEAIGEGGLLGAALHPDFTENRFVYLYQTTDEGGELRNRIKRYELRDQTLVFDRIILDDIPGARYHDGGRIAFGPDGYLYATVGDATRANEAQDQSSLEGTILRLTAEGDAAPGNPFDSIVYSYGHRNPQGLTWDDAGNLWSSEHGRSVGGSGFDEINLIEPGRNYGWPDSQGDEVAPGTSAPVRHSTAEVTWAPGDLLYHEGSLWMPGLRGRTLYEAELSGTDIVAWREHVVGEYGRLRTVQVGPDGLLHLLSSNRDGRGDEPAATDDRIIRIDSAQL